MPGFYISVKYHFPRKLYISSHTFSHALSKRHDNIIMYFLVKINQISRKPINKGKSRVYTGKDGDFTTNLLLFKSLAIMNM